MTQQLIGDLWVDTWRETNTYDASNNMLSDLYEYLSNGQWVNEYRYTYTYDASGNELSMVHENTTNGQWVNGSRITHIYDAQENLTSIWFYGWFNSSWTPRDFSDPLGRGFSITDSAANSYGLWGGYSFSFMRRLIVTGVAFQSESGPATYSLSQNYPNPFNPSTIIRYGLPQKSQVSMIVFNTLGQQVAQLVNGEVEAGYHEVRFDATRVASGVYFYRLQAGAFVEVKKFALVR